MSRSLAALILLTVGIAAYAGQNSAQLKQIAVIDRIMAAVKPGQNAVRLGDQRFTVEKMRSFQKYLHSGATRSAFDLVATWPGGIVPYDYATDLPAPKRALFEASTRRWAAVANLRFVPRTTEPNFVHVVNSTNSMDSYVGMIGGPQDLHFADWGDEFSSAHELGHALGMIHEQSRSDRDTYVTIVTANIDPKNLNNFDLTMNSLNKGAYDFDSIMHYNGTAFSVNGQPTIVCKPGYTQYQDTIGQRGHMSAQDAAGMALVYGAPTPPAVPANDNFAAAASITGVSGSVTAVNIGAGTEAGEPSHAGKVGGHSIWYAWTAPGAGLATLDTIGSNLDTLLGVYTGGSVGALTAIASNDDMKGGRASKVSFSMVPGVTYYIAVDGYNGVTGGIKLNWQFGLAPSNDNFANATVLVGNSGTLNGNNSTASKEPGEPDHGGNPGGHSLWYKWTAPAGGSLFLYVNNPDFDSTSAIYTGVAINALTGIVFNNAAGGGISAFNVLAGGDYYIAVDGTNGATGNFVVTWSFTPGDPGSDSYSGTPTLRAGAGTLSFSNVNATRDPGEPLILGNAGGHSVWFKWIAPGDGNVVFSTLGSTFDTLLGVFTGTGYGSFVSVAADNGSGGPNDSVVTFPVSKGVLYNVVVDGADGATGTGAINWQFSPRIALADNFADAINIGTAGTVTGDTTNFTTEDGEPDHAGVPGGSSGWFKWTAPVDGVVTMDTLGSDFDTTLAVYTGSSVDSLTEVVSNDDEIGVLSRVQFVAEAGKTYLVAIDGYYGDSGAAQVNVTFVPGVNNDSFIAPLEMEGKVGHTYGTNTGYSSEPGEPDHSGSGKGAQHSAWFLWTAPESGAVTMDTGTSDFDTTLDVFVGDTLGSLERVAFNDNIKDDDTIISRVTFYAFKGETYRIAVDGARGQTGKITLNWYQTAADFNRDGRSDIAFQEQSTGKIAVWYLDHLRFLGGVTMAHIPFAGWKAVGIGDFDLDGVPDLVFQNQNTNQIGIWHTDGKDYQDGDVVGLIPQAGYRVAAVADLNSDGSPDLVLQNAATGKLVVWYMDDTNVMGAEQFVDSPGPDYGLVGIADFNGDGVPDLVFQNRNTGRIVIWYMNGLRYAGGFTLDRMPDAGWRAVAVGDYNGDGKPDIVFQNQATGRIAVWYLSNGRFMSGESALINPSAGFKVVGPQ